MFQTFGIYQNVRYSDTSNFRHISKRSVFRYIKISTRNISKHWILRCASKTQSTYIKLFDGKSKITVIVHIVTKLCHGRNERVQFLQMDTHGEAAESEIVHAGELEKVSRLVLSTEGHSPAVIHRRAKQCAKTTEKGIHVRVRHQGREGGRAGCCRGVMWWGGAGGSRLLPR